MFTQLFARWRGETRREADVDRIVETLRTDKSELPPPMTGFRAHAEGGFVMPVHGETRNGRPFTILMVPQAFLPVPLAMVAENDRTRRRLVFLVRWEHFRDDLGDLVRRH